MPTDELISVEIVFAGSECPWRRTLDVPVGATVADVIAISHIEQALPHAMDSNCVGIYSQRVSPQQVVHDGDRIEVYRPLTLDPKDARRRRIRRYR